MSEKEEFYFNVYGVDFPNTELARVASKFCFFYRDKHTKNKLTLYIGNLNGYKSIIYWCEILDTLIQKQKRTDWPSCEIPAIRYLLSTYYVPYSLILNCSAFSVEALEEIFASAECLQSLRAELISGKFVYDLIKHRCYAKFLDLKFVDELLAKQPDANERGKIVYRTYRSLVPCGTKRVKVAKILDSVNAGREFYNEATLTVETVIDMKTPWVINSLFERGVFKAEDFAGFSLEQLNKSGLRPTNLVKIGRDPFEVYSNPKLQLHDYIKEIRAHNFTIPQLLKLGFTPAQIYHIFKRFSLREFEMHISLKQFVSTFSMTQCLEEGFTVTDFIEIGYHARDIFRTFGNEALNALVSASKDGYYTAGEIIYCGATYDDLLSHGFIPCSLNESDKATLRKKFPEAAKDL
jgi:hypothetical protein